MKIENIKTDVLIIGAGGAGARAAIEAARTAKQVILICRSPLGQGGLTPTGNGGYHAAVQPDDSPALHAEDLVAMGCGLNDRPLVDTLTLGSLEQAHILEQFGARVNWGVPKKTHDYQLRFSRSLFIPGREIMSALRRQLKKMNNVVLWEDHLALHLIKNDGAVAGALVFNIAKGSITVCASKATVLATGSLGEIYPFSAHEPMGIPTGSTGSGYVLAGWAEADLVDMEMVQFAAVPAIPPLIQGMRCLPEATLLNGEGREFLPANAGAYSHQTIQAVYRELKGGRGPITMQVQDRKAPSQARHPLTDQRNKHLQKFAATPYQRPITIGLGPLYMMGGVHINTRGETSVPGLYAAGEVTGSVHGARRVSGNAFPEMIVFGAMAGKYAAREAGGKKATPAVAQQELKAGLAYLENIIGQQHGDVDPRELRRKTRAIMGKYVHAIRNGPELKAALADLSRLEKELPFVRVKIDRGLPYNSHLVEAIDCRWLISAAQLVCRAALVREESRGFHFRSDFPAEKADWCKHTLVRRQGTDWVAGTKPVVI